ncbi:seminal metalloprotease 1-like [Ostrinia furnacalis]|uniref:seminal metalloprotease 1-like n=1 Tax=Ostrinia furnacalis TaxID=93504 RepID=UPI00103A77F4|nr:seminal metalloprotease 1-like [Ostrinia furnacalis]
MWLNYLSAFLILDLVLAENLKEEDYLVAERVRLAMNTIEESSCVRFKALLEPYSKSHWIHITNKARVRGCVHDGEVNGTYETVMTMGLDCMQRRDILHLLMHALGFKDEVTHPLRDHYVRILWDNIHPAYLSLFRIRYEDYPTINTEYDPTSIMHFHDRAYTKNGQATIASLVPGLVINPSRELSPLDKMKLRSVFGRECNRRKVDDLLDSCKAAMQENDGNQQVSEVQNPETDIEEDSNHNDMNNHNNEKYEDTAYNEEQAHEQTVAENNYAEDGTDK